jgi:nucleoside-diphosphate-sugar epimerase
MDVLNFYSGKKILITGANAYLGPKLAHQLSAVDCHLILHGHKNSNFVFPGSRARIESITGDLSLEQAWEDLLSGVDIIFHLAAHESRNFEPKLDWAVNAGTVLNLLETCRAHQSVLKIIFASSANLVGITDHLPVDESFADRPLTIYAIHKLTAERYFKYYADHYGIKSVTLRLANVYGPSIDLASFRRVAFNRMIESALSLGNITLFGNRHCVRDYLYIDDAISAFLTAGAGQNMSDGSFYVVGSGQGYNFSECARLIAETIKLRTGQKPQIANDDLVELVPAEFRNFVADSSRFKRLTGWEAKVSLARGIENTLAYLIGVL